MTGARISLFSIDQNIHFLPATGEPISDATIYCRLIGRLLYLPVTHPDIQFAVNNLS